MGAQILNDKQAQADAEYQIELEKIRKEKEAREKEVGRGGADYVGVQAKIDEEANQRTILAGIKRDETNRDNKLKSFDLDVQHNNMRVQLEGKTYAEIDALNRQALDSKIAYLDIEIAKETTNKEKRIQLKQQLVSAKESLQQISGRNFETAGAEGIRRIKEQQHDYAADVVQAYDAIGNSIEGHLTGILNRTEDFSSGFKNVFSDMIKSVKQMMIKMWMNKVIMGPLEQFLGSAFGISTGGVTASTSGVSLTASASNASQYFPSTAFKTNAKGGYNSGGLTLVGEEGPELINFAKPGQVYTAGQTNKILSGGGGQSQPQITINVINNTDTKVKTSQKATFDSETQTTIISLVIDAIDRNVGGMRDAVYGGAG